MRNWHEYWNHAPQVFERDPLRQVGKTVGGQPIDRDQLPVVVDSIVEQLNIGAGDTVLDLCCGNGILTYALARYCARIRGIDFSPPLIETAPAELQCREHHLFLCRRVRPGPGIGT